jgi:hypothetical protein
MEYEKQIDSSIYFTDKYITDKRWSTYSGLVELVLKNRPKNILEIGPGNNILKNILLIFGFKIKTLDFDESVKPDYVMDVSSDELLKLKNENFDFIIASEVLEHIEYKDFKKTLNNLKAISTGKIILTLPYAYGNSKTINLRVGRRIKFQKRIFFKREKHKFNGQHYWEIGKKGFSLNKIKKDILNIGLEIDDCYLKEENYYHYFFILNKKD